MNQRPGGGGLGAGRRDERGGDRLAGAEAGVRGLWAAAALGGPLAAALGALLLPALATIALALITAAVLARSRH